MLHSNIFSGDQLFKCWQVCPRRSIKIWSRRAPFLKCLALFQSFFFLSMTLSLYNSLSFPLSFSSLYLLSLSSYFSCLSFSFYPSLLSYPCQSHFSVFHHLPIFFSCSVPPFHLTAVYLDLHLNVSGKHEMTIFKMT